ncbi:MAG: hypothetical protein WCT32_03685 [Patescibacteria group bacterium]|jgi:hypothetical protein
MSYQRGRFPVWSHFAALLVWTLVIVLLYLNNMFGTVIGRIALWILIIIAFVFIIADATKSRRS